jgi:hypothetical protein
MADQLQVVRRRMREIDADLARRKSDFFNKGIEAPMKERAALEAELAELRLRRFDMEDLESKRAAQVRQRRAELLKDRLTALGLVHLIKECNDIAEAEVPPAEYSEASNG